jgi:ABC-type multidrug transport system ATPase subunit
VLLSTSYLDEAERCGHVVVLHSGHVLAQGAPAEITGTARERTFIADPPPGRTARGLQARLLEESDVVDAVPEAGRVRVVRASESGGDLRQLVAENDGANYAGRGDDGGKNNHQNFGTRHSTPPSGLLS